MTATTENHHRNHESSPRNGIENGEGTAAVQLLHSGGHGVSQ